MILVAASVSGGLGDLRGLCAQSAWIWGLQSADPRMASDWGSPASLGPFEVVPPRKRVEQVGHSK